MHVRQRILKKNKGTGTPDIGKNNMRYIKSRSGHMMVFDDTQGKEKMQLIASGAKTRVQSDKAAKKLSMESDLDIGINGKKKVVINGEEISIKSKKITGIEGEEVGIKSSKKADLKSSDKMGLKGSTLALN